MHCISKFNDEEKEQEIKSEKLLSYVIPMTFGEIHVIRAMIVFATMISQFIVVYPYTLISNIGKSPEYKAAFATYMSMFLACVFLYFLRFDIDSGLIMLRSQSFYKLWAVYTLFFIVLRFLNRIHKHTHRIIRGAIRSGHSLVIPILLHTISTMMISGSYCVYVGAYLAGLYGKAILFISACLHIQAVIAKKYFPKVLETLPHYNETINRFVMLFAIGNHLSDGLFSQIYLMVVFEYSFAFVRFFLTSITEDSKKVYLSLKCGSQSLCYQYIHNDDPFEQSIIMNAPIESFVVLTIFLMKQGPMLNVYVIAAIIAIFALFGPFLVRALAPDTKPEYSVEKKKKKKKEIDEEPTESKAEEKKEKKD